MIDNENKENNGKENNGKENYGKENNGKENNGKENNGKEKIENPIARLTEKVINSDFYFAIETSTYLRELQDPYSSISMQVKMAKRYNKPTIILIDSKLPEVKKLELDRHHCDMNIIGTIEIDWKSGKSIDDAMCQIDNILIKHGIK